MTQNEELHYGGFTGLMLEKIPLSLGGSLGSKFQMFIASFMHELKLHTINFIHTIWHIYFIAAEL